MTVFDDTFAAMGAPILQQEFGEPIVYFPLGGGQRSVMAIYVDRNPPSSLGEVPDALAPRLEIQVLNDTAEGIGSTEIDTGGDMVQVSKRKGVADGPFGNGPWRITSLLKDVNGITRFEVQEMVADLQVVLDKRQLADATRTLNAIHASLPKALAGAVNDTGRKTITAISKGIRARVNIKKKDIDPYLKRTFADPAHLASQLTLSQSKRIPLKYFGARQTTSGVSYKIAKDGGRGMAKSAFGPNIARLGGQVFKRAGKERFPIIKLRGPSPWGVFVKANLEKPVVSDAAAELSKNVTRRVRLAVLRKSGAVKSKER